MIKNKKLFWVPIFLYCTIEMNLNILSGIKLGILKMFHQITKGDNLVVDLSFNKTLVIAFFIYKGSNLKCFYFPIYFTVKIYQISNKLIKGYIFKSVSDSNKDAS